MTRISRDTSLQVGLRSEVSQTSSNMLILDSSPDTLKEILREIDNKLSEEDLDGIIEEVDEDGSGTLDFDGKYTEVS